MEQILLFAPLVGAILSGFGYKYIGETAAQWTATGLLFLAAFLSWALFLSFDPFAHENGFYTVSILHWIESGNLSVDWAIRMDRLTVIMLIVITSVSSLVHLYSFGYMAHDDHFSEGESYRPRFFAYLSFFTFTMLMLVTSDNLLQLFFGWEGVGVASYLLIGFYIRKQSAGAAAIKAFVVNRVGDFGFLLGIFALFIYADSINFSDVLTLGPALADAKLTFLWTDWNAANLVALLLFIGAMGKSAQFFLHTWLPDAMEGPTPVSALIHAATMVTAGVFLICRMSPVIEFAPETKQFIVYIGALTAFFAATVGLVQNDIKRVIAYSTCSQLGYMFVAAGVGVYSVAMFHLFTHAFFKAMLFLGAGSVIHGMHHEQDMRNYGGLRKKLPYTFWAMMIGTLAITGVGIPLLYIGFPVGFAGFISKDAIIESAFAADPMGIAFWALVVAALFTSFYSWRLMFMTFFGTPRGDMHTHDHAHESPKVMLIPLVVLAFGAVFAGMVWYKPFFGSQYKVEDYFGVVQYDTSDSHAEAGFNLIAAAHAAGSNDSDSSKAPKPYDGDPADDPRLGKGAIYMAPGNTVLDDAHHVPKWVKLAPFVSMILGFLVAYMFYMTRWNLPARWAATNPVLYQFLLNKWYVDEIYDAIFVRPTRWLGNFLWKKGDGAVIDATINGLAMGFVPFVTKMANKAQNGYIFTYALGMVIGIAALITWAMLAGN